MLSIYQWSVAYCLKLQNAMLRGAEPPLLTYLLLPKAQNIQVMENFGPN